MKIRISQIKIGKRIREDSGDIDDLAENIRECGLRIPINVRRTGENSYKLLDGFRRLSAAKLLRYETINAIIEQ